MITAMYKGERVQILDVYEIRDGVKAANVRALEGKPFVGGDKWPIYTELTIAEATELTDIQRVEEC